MNCKQWGSKQLSRQKFCYRKRAEIFAIDHDWQRLVLAIGLFLRVLAPLRACIDLYLLVDEVDDPILRNASMGIDTHFLRTVTHKGGVCNFYHERNFFRIWMTVIEISITTTNDRQIRFWFTVNRCDWLLCANEEMVKPAKA